MTLEKLNTLYHYQYLSCASKQVKNCIKIKGILGRGRICNKNVTLKPFSTGQKYLQNYFENTKKSMWNKIFLGYYL